jgi:predicted phosphoribosyltransferase
MLVLALPHGVVVVGFEVAEALKVPLDALVVPKLGVPGEGELAMGAIATGGGRKNRQYVRRSGSIIPRNHRDFTKAFSSARESRNRGPDCLLLTNLQPLGLNRNASV